MSDQDDSDFGYQTDDCESVAMSWSTGSERSFDWSYKREDGEREALSEEAIQTDNKQPAPDAKVIQIRYHLLTGVANLPNVPADFTITCNGFEFPIHRQLLTRHSSYFSTACDGRFKESTEHTINLDEESPVIVLHLISYFYQRPYEPRDWSASRTSDIFPDREQWSNMFSINAAVYVAAEKYDIPGLKTAALGAFWKEMPTRKHFRDAGLAESLARLIKDLLEVIPYIWENTVDRRDMLRNAVVNGLIADKGRLLARMIDRPDFLELVRAVPELAVEMMSRALPGQKFEEG